MSFKLFIYYCAVCGAWAAFVGWGLGWAFAGGQVGLGADVVKGLFLGLAVAMALAVIDALWTLGSYQFTRVFLRGLLVALVGGAAGAAGSAVGSWLVLYTGNTLFQIIGWTVVGLLIGVSVGLYDFVASKRVGDTSGGGGRKLRNGLLGGTLGGALGGLLFALLAHGLAAVFASHPGEMRFSTAFGFVVLGACIGLFIGLAQVILKEAWIRVESGRRAGREMILSKEETTIGRAESCDLGLFGDNTIERLHARILLQNSRYLLADAESSGGTFLNDRRIDKPTPLKNGDAIRVGSCVLSFGERQKKKK
jgi:hypothetical protein